jgi:hypothetical protein
MSPTLVSPALQETVLVLLPAMVVGKPPAESESIPLLPEQRRLPLFPSHPHCLDAML